MGAPVYYSLSYDFFFLGVGILGRMLTDEFSAGLRYMLLGAGIAV